MRSHLRSNLISYLRPHLISHLRNHRRSRVPIFQIEKLYKMLLNLYFSAYLGFKHPNSRFPILMPVTTQTVLK